MKSDLAYANGKMDVTSVQSWLNGADSLVKNAQDASTAGQYAKAGATAQAARELADTAESLMRQTLGADKLPSYSQLPTRPAPPNSTGTTTSTTITQAQASRDLQHTYNDILTTGVLLKNASGVSSDASTYLTSAQNYYKTAYSAYQAGKYTDAHNAARIAGSLTHVAGELMHAANAGTSSDTPVTVPAPNF